MQIKQSSDFMFSLLQEAARGRLTPAAMQRLYVWTKADVEALCDSILSGFPIGSFVIWSPGPMADLSVLGKGRLGPLEPEVKPAGYSDGLLLDGQNRLATLAWMAHQDPLSCQVQASKEERETWLSGELLVLDYETRSLKFVAHNHATVGLRLPAWTLMPTLGQGVFSSALAYLQLQTTEVWKARPEEEVKEFLAFWDFCCNRFREARVTSTTIEKATPEEARHAFIRICKVGVPISQEDFDRAISWSPQ